MEDVIVTLLDGTRINKSQVPTGEMYINEKGQKVRKVIKVVPVQKENEVKNKNFFGNLFSKLNSGIVKAKNIASSSSGVLQSVSALIPGSNRTVSKVTTVLDNILSKVLSVIQLDKSVSFLENYQESSGTDLGELIDLLKRFQTVQK